MVSYNDVIKLLLLPFFFFLLYQLWLWDIEKDDTQILDFKEELEALRQPYSYITSVYVDSSRSLIVVCV